MFGIGSSKPSSRSHHLIGIIVGAVVGGVLLLLIAAFLRWRRRSPSPHFQLEAFVDVAKDPETISCRKQRIFHTQILNPYSNHISASEHDVSVNGSTVSTEMPTIPRASIQEALPIPPTDVAGPSGNGIPVWRLGAEVRPTTAENRSSQEMQAMRRDILQLQQLVGRVDADGAPPPEYE